MTVVNVATLDCGQDDSTADSSRMAMNPHCLFKNYSIMGAGSWRMLSFIKMQFQGAQRATTTTAATATTTTTIRTTLYPNCGSGTHKSIIAL